LKRLSTGQFGDKFIHRFHLQVFRILPPKPFRR
jgi:hypothetical protein